MFVFSEVFDFFIHAFFFFSQGENQNALTNNVNDEPESITSLINVIMNRDDTTRGAVEVGHPVSS